MKDFCSHCGQKILKNKHIFSASLSNILLKIATKFFIGDVFNPAKDLQLTHNEINNLQKLQYWELIAKHYQDGRRLGGYWHLTKRAGEVLNGSAVPQTVITFNNQILEVSEERITLEQAIGYYDLPEQWAERQEKVRSLGQIELFSERR